MKMSILATVVMVTSVAAWADLPLINGHMNAASPSRLQIKMRIEDADVFGGQDPSCTGFSFLANVDIAANGDYQMPAVDLTKATCNTTVVSIAVVDKSSGRQLGATLFSDSFSSEVPPALIQSYTASMKAIRETQVINPTTLTFESKGMTLQQLVDRTVAQMPFLQREIAKHRQVTWSFGLSTGTVSALYGDRWFKDSDNQLISTKCNCFANSADGNNTAVTSKIPGEIGYVPESLLELGQHQFFAFRGPPMSRRSLVLTFQTPRNESSINYWVEYDLPNPDLNNADGNTLLIDVNEMKPVLTTINGPV